VSAPAIEVNNGELSCHTLTVPEAARLLGISRNAAYEAATRGELPCLRIGRRLLVSKQGLLAMIESASGDRHR